MGKVPVVCVGGFGVVLRGGGWLVRWMSVTRPVSDLMFHGVHRIAAGVFRCSGRPGLSEWNLGKRDVDAWRDGLPADSV